MFSKSLVVIVPVAILAVVGGPQVVQLLQSNSSDVSTDEVVTDRNEAPALETVQVQKPEKSSEVKVSGASAGNGATVNITVPVEFCVVDYDGFSASVDEADICDEDSGYFRTGFSNESMIQEPDTRFQKITSTDELYQRWTSEY